MRSVDSRPWAGRGKACWVPLLALLAVAPVSAKKHTPQRHPLVLPCQCLTYMQQLNAGTGFKLVCLSQVPAPGTGGMAQTAVVDLSPPAQATGPTGSFPLFMFPQDVPTVQQLNGGMGLQTTAIIPVTDVTGKTVPVAQVSVPGPGQSQTGQTGCLLVCPMPSLPLMKQLNPGLSMTVLCTSLVGAGKGNPASQTALLDVQPTHGIVDPSQPLPMLVPLDTLPALGQLNSGSIINVIDVSAVPAGGSAVLPVALIGVTQQEQSLNPSSPAKGDDEDEGDDSQGKGKGHGKDQGKDHGKGHGKSHGDDESDD
jgi:hypothetical protein